jgi:hypothetical protein
MDTSMNIYEDLPNGFGVKKGFKYKKTPRITKPNNKLILR